MEYVIRHSVFKSTKIVLDTSEYNTILVDFVSNQFHCASIFGTSDDNTVEYILDTFIQSDTDIWLHLRIMNDDLLSFTVRNYGKRECTSWENIIAYMDQPNVIEYTCVSYNDASWTIQFKTSKYIFLKWKKSL